MKDFYTANYICRTNFLILWGFAYNPDKHEFSLFLLSKRINKTTETRCCQLSANRLLECPNLCMATRTLALLCWSSSLKVFKIYSTPLNMGKIYWSSSFTFHYFCMCAKHTMWYVMHYFGAFTCWTRAMNWTCKNTVFNFVQQTKIYQYLMLTNEITQCPSQYLKTLGCNQHMKCF